MFLYHCLSITFPTLSFLSYAVQLSNHRLVLLQRVLVALYCEQKDEATHINASHPLLLHYAHPLLIFFCAFNGQRSYWNEKIEIWTLGQLPTFLCPLLHQHGELSLQVNTIIPQTIQGQLDSGNSSPWWLSNLYVIFQIRCFTTQSYSLYC